MRLITLPRHVEALSMDSISGFYAGHGEWQGIRWTVRFADGHFLATADKLGEDKATSSFVADNGFGAYGWYKPASPVVALRWRKGSEAPFQFSR